MGTLFGTDGIRGKANEGNLTPELALRVGRALAHTCQQKANGEKVSILIGNDTRLSGSMLESALSAGITSMGADVLLLGAIPTPAVAFLAQEFDADAGIMVSASHNPFFDNGIKIFGKGGIKLTDALEAELESLILEPTLDGLRCTGTEIGCITQFPDATECYVGFCQSTFPDSQSLSGLKMVLDCSNGATFEAAPEVFSGLGADIEVIFNEPDGMNINDECGSQHTETLRDNVCATGAQVGLALDGDGDRLIAVDETGAEVSGDQIIAICAYYYKERGLLTNNTVVGTVMSNIGFHAAMKTEGITSLSAGVGDRYVLELMKKEGAVVGGESSGHVLFLNHHTTGDGIIAALQLLSIMQETGKPLSELAKLMQIFPQILINVDVKQKPELSTLPELQAAIQEKEAELGDLGRVLIRYSGTQPMCRVMVEGPTAEQTQRIANELVEKVTALLG